MLPFDFVFLRALRVLKLLQLIKLFFLTRDDKRSLINYLHKTYLDKIILFAVIFVFIITILIRSFDSNINDLGTAFWYIIVSMTSTGYGDVVPATFTGKLIGIVTMIGGIIIFSIITAGFSSAYVSRLNRDERVKLEKKIDDLSLEIEKLNKKIDDFSDEE